MNIVILLLAGVGFVALAILSICFAIWWTQR